MGILPMRIAVYTAVAGGYDDLKPHPEIPGVDFVAFTDRAATNAEGWDVRTRPALISYGHPRMIAKAWKVLNDLALPDYDVSIWVDASHEILTEHFVDHCLASLVDADIALYEHPWRDCIYDEAKASVVLPKYADHAATIAAQMDAYRDEGYPAHGGLYACGTLARRHTPGIAALMRAWWHECDRWTYQDQLSFPVVCGRLGVIPAKFPCHQVYGNTWTAIQPHHRED
jgi:hypothetical protein